MIALNNVSKSFKGKPILKHINLTVNNGEVYCLLGRNGAGKSTIMNLLTHMNKPDEGEVRYDSQVFAENSNAIYLQLGIQPQYNTLIEDLTGYDYLNYIGLMYHLSAEERTKQIAALAGYFLLQKEELNNAIKGYSPGMKKKLVICAALIHKPKYVLLDEPFANIDPVFADAICRLIKQYKNEKRAFVVASHDLMYIDKIATHIGVLENGELVFNGTLAEFKSNRSIEEALLRVVKDDDGANELITQIVS